MANYNAKQIRNIVLLGHQSSGKTSLVESLALTTGLISVKGEVEKKTPLSDYTDAEKLRGASIQTAVIPLERNGYKVNVIDVPGNDDFISEYMGAPRIVKGAVLLVDASVGVQVGTVKHWNNLRRRGVPTFILLNKMDKENVKFEEVLEDIHAQLGKEAIPFCFPLGHGEGFDGFVNLVNQKAMIFDGILQQIVSHLKSSIVTSHQRITALLVHVETHSGILG